MNIDVLISGLIKERLAEAIRPLLDEINLLKSELAEIKKDTRVEEYMPMQYFLDKWKTSKQTFNKIASKSKVNRYRKLNCNLYNTAQAELAYKEYKPAKPLLKNSFLRSA